MTPTRLVSRLALAVGLIACAAAPGRAQESVPGSSDSLRLGTLHHQALEGDPRQREFDLLAKQTRLRLRNLSAEWLTTFDAESQAQYQSEVFSAPAAAKGLAFPTPKKDTYDSRLSMEQSLLDLSLGARKKVERAQLSQSQAQVRTALNGLRQEVNDAFFSAALLVERSRILAVTVADLEKQMDEARVRVREGAALPSDTAAIRATLLERRQDEAEVEADRRAALTRLGDLIKRPVSDSDRLALPDLAEAATQARRELERIRVRPEYDQFARTRDVLARQQQAVSADRMPRLSAFGNVGYGRPGLNPISDSFDHYFIGGVKVNWSPWNWGSTGREREAIALQRQIVASEEEAFTRRLTRDIQSDLADIDRLDTALSLDDQIVSLRERVEVETQARLKEGVVTASEYVDRSTDVLEARLARARHRVEQVQARARFLTTLGLEIQ